MNHSNSVFLIESFHNRSRTSRTADHNLIQMRQFIASGFKIIQQHQPDSWHSRRDRTFFTIEQFIYTFSIHHRPWHYQIHADHWRGKCQRPSIGMEHWYHHQTSVLALNIHCIRHGRGHRHQGIGAVRV